ncbi:MAG: GTP pyrophosphokinase [Neptuniibacter pectenicola]|jgi:GTP pyrophosphokinase
MYAALGAGDLRLSQIINSAQSQILAEDVDEQLDLALPSHHETEVRPEGVKVRGVGNLLSTMASCCTPVLGDQIAGYITQGRGISVHREDCSNFIQLQEKEPERIIEVDWGVSGETTYPVDIFIEAFDRPGLLRDVMLIMAAENVNIVAANTLSDKRENMARLTLTVEISSLDLLGRVMDKVNQIPNVMEVYRQRSGIVR